MSKAWNIPGLGDIQHLVDQQTALAGIVSGHIEMLESSGVAAIVAAARDQFDFAQRLKLADAAALVDAAGFGALGSSTSEREIQAIVDLYNTTVAVFPTYKKLSDSFGIERAVEQASQLFAMHSSVVGNISSLKATYDVMLCDPISQRLPTLATRNYPAVNVATYSSVVGALSAEADDIEAIEEEVWQALPPFVLRQIDAIAPRLAVKLQSALRNLGSTDPQAAAHAAVDMRQVFFGLLRVLAPDKLVRPWALARNEPSLFRDGDVTKETTYVARIFYVSRFDLDEPSAYSRFLLKNADVYQEFLRVIGGEVHDESPEVRSTPPLAPLAVKHIVLWATAAFGGLITCAGLQVKRQSQSH